MRDRVFFSYSRNDQKLVESIARFLRKRGLLKGDAFTFDPAKDLSPGDDVRSAIREQIESANTVVVIATENSMRSSWVHYEAGLAGALGKRVLVVGPRGAGKSALMQRFPKSLVVDVPIDEETLSAMQRQRL
ncbi:MAG: TIR domain-containing protein [Deltaproteobacteria bacterium]|nr:TIR domain-containing protein [Deltaproteobacteria bacterium]